MYTMWEKTKQKEFHVLAFPGNECRTDYFQTSYFIVDEAVCELGLPPDPFMAKARPVPPQLPYRDAKKSK